MRSANSRGAQPPVGENSQFGDEAENEYETDSLPRNISLTKLRTNIYLFYMFSSD